MTNRFFSGAVCAVVVFAAQASQGYQIKEEAHFFYSTEVHNDSNSRKIQLYWSLLPKQRMNRHLEDDIFQAVFCLNKTSSDINPRESYHALIVRSSFVVDKAPEFFLSNTIYSLGYLQYVLSQPDIIRESFNSYSVPSKGFQPGFQLSQRHWHWSDLDLYLDTSTRDCWLDLIPDFEERFTGILHQRSHNFSRVMGTRTSHSADTLSFFVPIADQPHQTLVLSFTVSLIYNTPPRFAGGSERLKREYLESMIRSASKMSSF